MKLTEGAEITEMLIRFKEALDICRLSICYPVFQLNIPIGILPISFDEVTSYLSENIQYLFGIAESRSMLSGKFDRRKLV